MSVKDAGGFIIQLMPDALDSDIDKLEANVKKINSITHLLEEGLSPEEMLQMILGDMGLEILSEMPVSYECDCSKDRVGRALLSIGKGDLQEMVDEGKPVELKCHFCNTVYTFTPDEIREMMGN